MQYWLLKTEPEVYSFDQLQKEGQTKWDGVRNYQARNYIKTMQPKDLALIYHTSDERCVVGLAQIASTPLIEVPADPKQWVYCLVQPLKRFMHAVPLATLKAEKTLQGLLLLKQPRLSVIPLLREEFDWICKQGGL